jgi:insertion element IS1 protein InsB
MGSVVAMSVREVCPACGSRQFKKHGHIHHGKQNHQWHACPRQFVTEATERSITPGQHTLIERLLCERISLRGICRAVGVSLPWLMHFMVERCAACPEHLHAQLPKGPAHVVIHQMEAEADEIWTFVQKKANRQWIWMAMDAATRQIIAFHVGDRSRGSANELWAKIPGVYREQATFHTDQYEPYKSVTPAGRHKAITKKALKTHHIERLNDTLRQRVSHLVCETLSCSKKFVNHIGAIKYFICHYNLTNVAA